MNRGNDTPKTRANSTDMVIAPLYHIDTMIFSIDLVSPARTKLISDKNVL